MKHKQAGGTDFVFPGPNTQALQVQTCSGIKNVRHNERPDHDLFIWNEGEERHLSVELEQVENSGARSRFEDSSENLAGGSLPGAAVGSLIGDTAFSY